MWQFLQVQGNQRQGGMARSRKPHKRLRRSVMSLGMIDAEIAEKDHLCSKT
jgi:hypothetical protein